MAKLKEILPLILGGVAGAASPQGAETMMSLADMVNRRGLEKERLAANQRSEGREDKRLESTLSLNDLRSRKAERDMQIQDEDRARAESERLQLKESIMGLQGHPQFADVPDVGWGLLSSAKSVDEADRLLKAMNKPPLSSVIEDAAALKEAGLGGQVYGDGVTAYVPGKTPIQTTPEAKKFLDIQDDDGYKAILKDIRKDRESIDSAHERVKYKREGDDKDNPLLEAKLAERQQLARVDQAITRAALLANGDPEATRFAVSDILSAAGMTEAQYNAMKAAQQGGNGQQADTGTVSPDGQMISSHGTPSADALWEETHGS